MPISPTRYLARAAKLEELAAISEEATKLRYLELAAELRKLAGEPEAEAQQSDQQIEQLAERMVGNTAISSTSSTSGGTK